MSSMNPLPFSDSWTSKRWSDSLKQAVPIDPLELSLNIEEFAVNKLAAFLKGVQLLVRSSQVPLAWPRRFDTCLRLSFSIQLSTHQGGLPAARIGLAPLSLRTAWRWSSGVSLVIVIRVVSIEFDRDGTKINCICPGVHGWVKKGSPTWSCVFSRSSRNVA